MQVPVKSEEARLEQSMEERLAKVGAKIDDLIDRGAEAREEIKKQLEKLKVEQEATIEKGEEALDELRVALDRAWEELNHAWKEIKEGTERAADKFRSK